MKNSTQGDTPLTTKSVIVAEDDDLNYLFINLVLEQESITVIRAENGQEAVDIFQQHPEIHLILMDIKMPVMDGIEATRRIKAINPDIIIIALTAYALLGDKEKTIEAGCDYYLSKPIEKISLLKILNKYL